MYYLRFVLVLSIDAEQCTTVPLRASLTHFSLAMVSEYYRMSYET